MALTPADITMVKDAIHNPGDIRHFMRVATPTCVVTAHRGELELARSTRALKLKEVAFDIYDAVLYFPRADVSMERLAKNAKTTHCPLKGDTEYFDLVGAPEAVDDVAWSYDRTIDIAAVLRDYIAFDKRLVTVIEHTAAAHTG